MRITKTSDVQPRYTVYDKDDEDIATIEQLKNMSWVFCPSSVEFSVESLEKILKFIYEIPKG